jgi:uncharacterized protein (TIGR02246 family)
MNAVERLVAIEEIRDLIARYAISYDDHDWDDYAQLWTEDAAFVVNGVAFEGREVMLKFLSECLPDDYVGKHMNSNSRIEIAEDGESARAQTDVVWIAQNFENSIVARYSDTFVRRDGRWLFARREESTMPFKQGFPPYSEVALSVSGSTMRAE